jgi:hypothetical protein
MDPRRSTPVADDPIADLLRAIAAIERDGYRLDRDAPSRTAVRARLMMLVDCIEIEQGKRRLLEGHFAAARYHFGAVRRQPMKLRLARVALRVAPRLLRSCCLRLRPTFWSVHPATS